MHASQQIANDIARLVKSDNIRDKVLADVGLEDLRGYSIELDSSEKNRVSYFIVKGPDPQKVAAITDSVSKHTAELAKQILEVESVTIFDKVKVPEEPSGPYRYIIVAVAAGCGLFLALVIIFFKDALSNKIKNKEDLLSLTGINVFAEFPRVEGHIMGNQKAINKMFFDRKLLRSAEKLIANIRFYSEGNNIKSLSVVSAEKNEGKTLVSANMAASFAKQGASTLLIDADIHHRSISKLLNSGSHYGMMDMLEQKCLLEEGIVTTPIDKLYFLDCASQFSSIPELLSHPLFNNLFGCLKQNFEYVVFDTPPVLFCSDSALISNIVDATIFVARENKSVKKNVRTALNQLSIAKANIIGSVLTCSSSSEKYYYYDHRK